MLGTCKLSIILPRQHTAGLGEPEVDLRLVELNPIPCDTGDSLTPRPNNRVTPKGMLKGYFLVSTTRSAWPGEGFFHRQEYGNSPITCTPPFGQSWYSAERSTTILTAMIQIYSCRGQKAFSQSTYEDNPT